MHPRRVFALAVLVTAGGCQWIAAIDDKATTGGAAGGGGTTSSSASSSSSGGATDCDGGTRCDGACIDMNSDPNHCGRCDRACDSHQACERGACVCRPDTCHQGCCRADGRCQYEDDDTACGKNGDDCTDCTQWDYGHQCFQGACQCSDNSNCRPQDHCVFGLCGCHGTCDVYGCGPDCPASPTVTSDDDDGTFRIDAYEVTNIEYLAFFVASPAFDLQSERCAWNTDYLPLKWDQSPNAKPVVGVNFCQAEAYCKWAKKRLCGKIGGGPTPWGSSIDGRVDQWFHACGNSFPTCLFHDRSFGCWPYGNQFDATACETDGDGPAEVGSKTGCHGDSAAGFGALFDMSGNAAEWEDDCKVVDDDAGAPGRADLCLVRGGSFRDADDKAKVECNAYRPERRDAQLGDVGFRCCSDP